MKKIISYLLTLLMVLPAAVCTAQDNGQNSRASYAGLIFDNACIHTVEVSMSEEDRAGQLARATDKTRYRADVVIDGEEVRNVCFRTKGNSSLFFTAAAGKDKYSYGIDFGRYAEGQTFHGLDHLNFQNNFADATMLKDYMAFWLFRRTGVDAPPCFFCMAENQR